MARAGEKSASAAANVPDWSLGKNSGSDIESEYFHGLAGCIVDRWPDNAAALVVSFPDSAEQHAVAEKLMENAGLCVFSGQIRMQPSRLRGAIAEALLKKGHKPLRAAWLSAGETPDSLLAKLSHGHMRLSPQLLRALTGRVAAFCAVREKRPLVEALLRTPTGSRKEQAALMSLNPTLSRCLGLRLMRFEIAGAVRAYLAEALYWQRGVEGAA
jgi:hypothetical protein